MPQNLAWATGECEAARTRLRDDHPLFRLILAVMFSKRPVGVEPTLTGLQPVAGPSGSSLRVRSLLTAGRTITSVLRRVRLNPAKTILAGKFRPIPRVSARLAPC